MCVCDSEVCESGFVVQEYSYLMVHATLSWRFVAVFYLLPCVLLLLVL